MKKLWLLIFVFIPFTNVFAITTYYSDYRDYKIGTEEVLELNDTLMKEEYLVYNTEIIESHDLGYVPENMCQYKVENDTKVEYTIVPVSNRNHRWYQSINIPNGKINRIDFYNELKNTVSDFRVYDGNNKVNVSLINGNEESNKLIDNSTSTYYTMDYYETYSFTFNPIDAKRIRLSGISIEKLNGKVTFYYENGNKVIINMRSDELDIQDSTFIENLKPTIGTYYSYGGVQLNPYEKEEKVLFHCYRNDKVLTNNYKKESEILENETLIPTDSKKLFDYYIRDKVKISDKQITSSNYDLKDLVTLSTVDNFRIEENIDYSKNGTYPVKFIFGDDFIVEKNVVINIAKNNKPTTTTTTVKPVNNSTSTTTSTTPTKKITTGITKVTSTTEKITTTVPTTTKVINTTTKSTNITTTKKSSIKTTTVKANNSYPTYKQDDEVIQVEPLKGVIEEKKSNDNHIKIIIISILLIILLLLIILYLIIRRKEKDK